MKTVEEECPTCLGTKVVEDTKHSLSLGYGGFKPCPTCQPHKDVASTDGYKVTH